MSKNKLVFIILLVAASVIGGACGYFGIDYLKEGGTAEGTLDYIEKTVIPALIPAAAFIGAAIMTATPIISKVQAVISAFKKAKDSVEDVRENGAQSVMALDTAMSELNEVKALIAGEVSNLKRLTQDNAVQYERIKKALEIAFTNNTELVKKGYAKQIYEVLEPKKTSDVLIANKKDAGGNN